jgi:hypothetical protein
MKGVRRQKQAALGAAASDLESCLLPTAPVAAMDGWFDRVRAAVEHQRALDRRVHYEQFARLAAHRGWDVELNTPTTRARKLRSVLPALAGRRRGSPVSLSGQAWRTTGKAAVSGSARRTAAARVAWSYARVAADVSNDARAALLRLSVVRGVSMGMVGLM